MKGTRTQMALLGLNNLLNCFTPNTFTPYTLLGKYFLTYIINELTKMFIEQPRLHRVWLKHFAVFP